MIRIRLSPPIAVWLFVCSFFSARAQDNAWTISGHLRSAMNSEISGIAASKLHRGLFYIHNDSGDSSRFFLINAQGVVRATFSFPGDPSKNLGVSDCEDIAVGPGPEMGQSYVYLGDIGDNGATRSAITVFRMKEPTSVIGGDTGFLAVNAAPVRLVYPDGPRDAETLMVDPIDKLLYIVSKREDSVRVYTAPLSFQAGDTVMLTRRSVLFFEKTARRYGKQITSGAISFDGKQVLLKSYSSVFYWKRTGREPIWQLLTTSPASLPYCIERQGEAISFTTNGKKYYTVSEGAHAPLFEYRLP